MADAVSQKNPTLMSDIMAFAKSSVGSKVIMALSGAGLWLFIIAHLAGNLSVFFGRETFNHYAEALKGNPPLLWSVRIALIVGFPVHILTAIRTVMLNRAARPVAYAYANNTEARMAAKSMMISGLIVLAFFAYHLAHFTLQITGPQPGNGANGMADPYSMLVAGFQQPLIAIFYIVAQVLLATHLSHGIYSLFQHLGVAGKQLSPMIKTVAQVVGYGICALFISIPVSVLAGVIKP
jgi:succinate dehydrogenase / fumarate reductase, cytochrome b subunit